ncbi:MAG: hypothetical protein K2X57_03475, partial [Xanthobacteraceae bacterium]|nr:hypothetical protein [Xanthobacteraceae bacterium]
MFLAKFRLGDAPRKDPGVAIATAVMAFVLIGIVSFAALIILTPIRPEGIDIDFRLTFTFWYWEKARDEIVRRAMIAVALGAISSIATFLHAWINTPVSEPFLYTRDGDPRLYYHDNARIHLLRRLVAESGVRAKTGLYLAPHLPLPFPAET